MPDVGLSMPRERRALPSTMIRGSNGKLYNLPPAPIRKEDAPCCMALVDELGRPPIGECSPSCIRKAMRLAWLASFRQHGQSSFDRHR